MAKFNPMDLIMGAMMHANPVVGMIGSIVSSVVGQAATSTLSGSKVGNANDGVSLPAVADVAKQVMDQVNDKLQAAGATIAPVKSGWLSKINWVQLAGPASSLAAAYGLDLPAGKIVGLVIAVQTVQSVVTWIMRTWFTRSVTKASA